jgi:hypothetical protein
VYEGVLRVGGGMNCSLLSFCFFCVAFNVLLKAGISLASVVFLECQPRLGLFFFHYSPSCKSR